MPAAGRITQFFLLISTGPGVYLLGHPCTRLSAYSAVILWPVPESVAVGRHICTSVLHLCHKTITYPVPSSLLNIAGVPQSLTNHNSNGLLLAFVNQRLIGSKDDPESAVKHLVSLDSDIPCSPGFRKKMMYQFSVNEVADTWGIFGV